MSGVDEEVDPAMSTAAATAQLADRKASAVARRFGRDDAVLVLGCDSLLELDGRAVGKPGDGEAVRARWRAQRGRSGVLHTGHALIEPATERRLVETASTVVHFADVSDDEIEAYLATGEPLGVAGAFTIDGRGAAFVRRIEGDHGTVIGLSLPLLRTMLADLGHPITGFWR